MGHIIPEIAMKFGFSRTTISQVYPEYRESVLHFAWARQHRHWTVDDWKHDAWSDEFRFQLNRDDGCVQVRRKTPESMDPTCTLETVQDGGGSVTISTPVTSTDLWTTLQDSRRQLPPALLQILIESMSRHVAALQRTHGGSTLY
ncbi:uncharacterized protein TNCV_2381751 [Trichonephila clavipes]|nr:uncharacterized protein TNCV_2381751 [Trichonephila clavipes]